MADRSLDAAGEGRRRFPGFSADPRRQKSPGGDRSASARSTHRRMRDGRGEPVEASRPIVSSGRERWQASTNPPCRSPVSAVSPTAAAPTAAANMDARRNCERGGGLVRQLRRTTGLERPLFLAGAQRHPPAFDRRRTEVAPRFDPAPSARLRTHASRPEERTHRCAFGEYGSIVRSTDDGVIWQPIDSGTDAELRKGLLEPDSGDLVIVGQQGTILRSADAGQDLATNSQPHPALFSQRCFQLTQWRSRFWSANASCDCPHAGYFALIRCCNRLNSRVNSVVS